MGERAQVLSGNGSALLGGAGSGDEALAKDFSENRADRLCEALQAATVERGIESFQLSN